MKKSIVASVIGSLIALNAQGVIAAPIISQGDSDQIEAKIKLLNQNSDDYVLEQSQYNALQSLEKATEAVKTQNQGEITKLNGDIAHINTFTAKLDREITGLENTTDSKLQTLKNLVHTNAGAIKTNTDAISLLKPDVNQLKQDASKNKSDIANLQGKVDGNTQGLLNVNGQLTKDKAAQKLVDDAQDKSLTRVDGLATKANILSLQNKGKLATLEPKVQQNSQDIGTIKGDIGAIKGDIATNKSGIATNKDSIKNESQRRLDSDTQLSKRIDGVDTKITGVDAKADKAQSTADTAVKGVQAVQRGLNTEKTQREQADKGLFNQIQSRATQSELKTEIARATKAENTEKANRENGDKALKSQIDLRVTKGDFTKDQQRQDGLITKAQGDASTAVKGIGKLGADLTKETNRAKGAESKNASDIATNKADVAAHKTAIGTVAQVELTTIKGVQQNHADIQAQTAKETQHFQTLQRDVAQAQSTGDYAKARADKAYANADANRKALDATNKRVAAHTGQLNDHEKRIKDLESNTPTNFNKLQDQQNHDRKEARAGISGAIALTQIPGLNADQAGSFGMGVGTFNGESAIAAGVSSRISHSVTVKSGLSWDTQGNLGAGAGVSVGW